MTALAIVKPPEDLDDWLADYDAVALAARVIPGEQPPPIDHAVLEAIRKANVCAWCFEPLGARRAEFNGGVGHVGCAMHAYHAVAGFDGPALPWLPAVRTWREDQITPFCQRLGREAARLGIDANKIATAIGRALCA